MRIEADTLQKAFEKAAKELKCSVADLPRVRVIQKPSKGVLGLFKKPAVIEVEVSALPPAKQQLAKKIEEKKEEEKEPKINPEAVVSFFKKATEKIKKKKESKEPALVEEKVEEFDNPFDEKDENIFEGDMDEVIKEVKKKIKKLFEVSCFDLDEFEVKKWDEDTIYIKIDGPDAALLIGKEGYRYNALHHMLYQWIHSKYGYKIRLEIAEFLEVQEEMLKTFLASFIEKVKEQGYGKTKPFKGILVYIALEILREAFPDKYVAIKERNGEKFIVVGSRDEDNSGNFNS